MKALAKEHGAKCQSKEDQKRPKTRGCAGQCASDQKQQSPRLGKIEHAANAVACENKSVERRTSSTEAVNAQNCYIHGVLLFDLLHQALCRKNVEEKIKGRPELIRNGWDKTHEPRQKKHCYKQTCFLDGDPAARKCKVADDSRGNINIIS